MFIVYDGNTSAIVIFQWTHLANVVIWMLVIFNVFYRGGNSELLEVSIQDPSIRQNKAWLQKSYLALEDPACPFNVNGVICHFPRGGAARKLNTSCQDPRSDYS